MAINIKDSETDRLARALAAATGESVTAAIREALCERLARVSHRARRGIGVEIRDIQKCVARLPLRDHRATDMLVRYDDYGVPS